MFLTFIFSIFLFYIQASTDPFKDFKYIKLKNGMRVVLAPHENAKNVSIKLIVKTGHKAETKETLEVNHLLEHMLFRDSSILDDKSYLQLIKEEGGKVNGFTKATKTVYKTKISSDKLYWTLGNFKKMIFNRKFNKKSLELAKSSIFLEIGEPDALLKFLGIDIFGVIERNYFPNKGFLEKEFGISQYKYTTNEEGLSLEKLTLSNINEVYSKYYYPSNMTLFISGKLEVDKVSEYLQEEFGSIDNITGLTVEEPMAKLGEQDYISRGVTFSGSTEITVGKKLFKNTVLDAYIIDSYMSYVAHRLMIELRNKKGETYTVSADKHYTNGYGYSYINFETPTNLYSKNLMYVENILKDEAEGGNLSDAKINEAISIYLKQKYEILDFDADSLMILGESYYGTYLDYPKLASPYKLLKNISPDQYRKQLKYIFNNNGDYIVLEQPPLLFKFDMSLFVLFGFYLGVTLFKFFFDRKTHIENIHWEIKTSHSSGYIVECFIIFFFALLFTFIAIQPIDYFFENSSFTWVNSVGFRYFYCLAWPGSFSFILVSMLSLHRKSLMMANGRLYLNHLAFRRQELRESEIESISLLSPLSLRMYHPKYRFEFSFLWCKIFKYNPFTPILTINMKSGPNFYLDFKDSQEIKDKIEATFKNCNIDNGDSLISSKNEAA